MICIWINIFSKITRYKFPNLIPNIKKPTAVKTFSTINNNMNPNSTRTRKIKFIFSTLLFGSTFLAIFYGKRKKRNEMQLVFQDCTLLPADENYAKQMFYSCQGFVLPDFVVKERQKINNFEVRPDDIFVISFPKTGTTWVQELVYLIASGLDFETAKKMGLETRFPYLEFLYPGIRDVEKMKSPRYIKSHLPFSLLPPDVHVKKPKIICVMRNPRDVSVSFYHFVQMLSPTSYRGTFEEFLKTFLDDKVMYGPLWKHYLEFWEHRNDDNILILMYEDLQKDVLGAIRKICSFLGCYLTEEEIAQVAEHCRFEKMAANPAVNYKYWGDIGIQNKHTPPFMRKGMVGDWRNYFTSEMDAEASAWEEKYFEKSGMKFVYAPQSAEST